MKSVTDPFPKGCMGSERFRIPAMLTTQKGTVLAACDARWNHGEDSAGNLETVIARSHSSSMAALKKILKEHA